jgi:hypothetical protein
LRSGGAGRSRLQQIQFGERLAERHDREIVLEYGVDGVTEPFFGERLEVRASADDRQHPLRRGGPRELVDVGFVGTDPKNIDVSRFDDDRFLGKTVQASFSTSSETGGV